MQIQTRAVPAELASYNLPYPPLIQRVLAARGITHIDDLQHALKQLLPIRSLRHVYQAAELLADAVQAQHKILIVGDYDADGATATAVSLRALRLMGHTQVEYLVPDRFKYGYGLTPEIIELTRDYQPWLLMTVDNGVSSVEGVEAAKALGYKTLITDHHLAGKRLPACDVMVNPNHPLDEFASKHLAGVGVVFYVMLALKQVLSQRGYFQQTALPEPNLTSLLDLVALGTVADVVTLDANNRILVEQGLRCIRAGKGKAGIIALLEMANRKPEQVISSDFGFACGPRLNAAGRIADMSIGIQCLLTDDLNEARRLAGQLEALNNERKRIEAAMKQDAEVIIQSLSFAEYEQALPPIMCLHQAEWHEGVIGILASRIKDRYYRPTVVFATADDGLVKGSARCIPGLHMRDLIEEVAHTHPGLIKRFGGHAMAAGLTLEAQALPLFTNSITQAVNQRLQPDTLRETIYTDGVLNSHDFTLSNAEFLRHIAPWGQQFPEPQFEGEFQILRLQLLKTVHIKADLKLIHHDSDYIPSISALNFFANLELWPKVGERVRLIYKLSVNEYRGEKQLQLMVEKVIPYH